MARPDPVSRAATGRVRAGDLESIAALEDAASTCQLCRLCRERTQVVTASGPADADVLVIAEAPGYHEDRTGELLVGRAGDLFDEVLADAGLTREDIFLTSVVKCRPPAGRTPFPDEVEACEGWLFREIALVRPRVVVTLGSLALRLVTGRFEQIRDVHGEMMHVNLQGRDLVVWPLFHPAAAVHVSGLVQQLRADARALGTLLRGARANPRDAGGEQPSAAASGAASPTSTEPAAPPLTEPAAPQPDPVSEQPADGEPQLTMDI